MGCARSKVADYENGCQLPNLDNFAILANALNVTTDFLLGRTTEPRTAGPLLTQLLNDFARLTDDQQQLTAAFARALVHPTTE